jgi:DNA repair exonuclease SbcCD nuclease subunit
MEYAKFGFITDTHYDYKYESRKDNTLDTLIDKTKQCYQWFKEKGCSFVIHGGDMFDRHRIYNFDLITLLVLILVTNYHLKISCLVSPKFWTKVI